MRPGVRGQRRGTDQSGRGFHTGGFNRNTWGVAMIGNFDDVPPTPIQLRTVGRLLGWRLGLDGVDPKARWHSSQRATTPPFRPVP
jgi:uncharacterized protein with LGFP repeats